MNEALRTYPLNPEEQKSLFKTTLASQAIVLGAGIACAIAYSIAQHGWKSALPFGWIADILAKMTVHWSALALAIAMIVLLEAFDAVATKASASYRDTIVSIRQGITGELPRLPLSRILICMTITGVCEEMLFRYGLLGLTVLIVGAVLPAPTSWLAASLLVSIVFWAMHEQYHDPWAAVLVICISLLLCLTYLSTGSLLSVMFAHAVYNVLELMIERYKMAHEADYFHGKAPQNAIAELVEARAGKPRTIDEKRADEKETLCRMIGIYCQGKRHGNREGEGGAPDGRGLCPSCRELADYACERVDRCPEIESKTFCSSCPVHCYGPKQREHIREVMRYAGPRMLVYDPKRAIRHWRDKKDAAR